MQYQTTACYFSGGICGPIWWPVGQLCGKPHRQNCRGLWGFFEEGKQLSFRDALLSLLTREGGDFQHAQFTADSVIRIERRTRNEVGKYQVHVKELELARLPDCADLVNEEAYTGDFFNDE